MRIGLLFLAVATVACSAPRERLPANRASGGPAFRIAPDEALGWIGLSTTPTASTVESFGPRNDEHPLVTTAPRDALPATVSAIGPSGSMQPFTTGRATEIPYGCDGHTLEVTALAGRRVPPGVAWLLPPSRPANWQPRALAIETKTKTAASRSYVIGPLALQLVRTADLQGTLTIQRDGSIVDTQPFERQLMDGAEPGPIDLAEGGPGIPEPLAAWSVADGGPILVVLTQPGYEGTTLRPLLVEATSARVIESMEMYLYQCAF